MSVVTAISPLTKATLPTWANYPLLSLELEFEMKSHFRLPPFAGSMFRGVLGWALKELCSPEDYRLLFEPSSDTPGQTDSARPFVLVPPRQQRNLRPRDRFRVTLNLLGPATRHAETFIEAMVQSGQIGLGAERAGFELVKVQVQEGTASWLCYERSGRRAHAYFPLPSGLHQFCISLPVNLRTMVVDFLTPTRIVHQGTTMEQPPFHAVLRALYRRLDALLQQQGLAGLEVDFRGDIHQAQSVQTVYQDLEWVSWERTSQRQGRRHGMGGVVGRIVYEGDLLDHWWTLLGLTRFLHLGKATTFGMGLVQIASDDEPSTPTHNALMGQSKEE